jgi:hypothetical protein
MGRLDIESDFLFILGGLLYKIKYSDRNLQEMIMGLMPVSVSKIFKKEDAKIRLEVAVE